MNPILLAYAATAADEAAPSAGVYGAYQACSECLLAAGVDPAVAGPAAIVLAVVLRPLVDEVYRWSKRRVGALRKRKDPPASPPQ